MRKATTPPIVKSDVREEFTKIKLWIPGGEYGYFKSLIAVPQGGILPLPATLGYVARLFERDDGIGADLDVIRYGGLPPDSTVRSVTSLRRYKHTVPREWEQVDVEQKDEDLLPRPEDNLGVLEWQWR